MNRFACTLLVSLVVIACTVLAAADDESANSPHPRPQVHPGDVRPRDPDCIGIGDCDCRGNGEPTARPTSTVPPTTPFDGTWASDPMTKATMDAALTRPHWIPSKFKPWFSDWTGVDHRIFEMTIKDGRWNEKDYNDGVWDGGFEAPFTVADASTLVVRDEENSCDVPFVLAPIG